LAFVWLLTAQLFSVSQLMASMLAAAEHLE
jgi:hypothetical protein